MMINEAPDVGGRAAKKGRSRSGSVHGVMLLVAGFIKFLCTRWFITFASAPGLVLNGKAKA
jgi:hypothetical protein